MNKELRAYRANPREQERERDLISRIPGPAGTLLDIGARDGYLSTKLAQLGWTVTALDLERPHVEHPRVTCVAGDVRALEFEDASFDIVLCAEVLEHIAPPGLLDAAAEI